MNEFFDDKEHTSIERRKIKPMYSQQLLRAKEDRKKYRGVKDVGKMSEAWENESDQINFAFG